jgi:CBS domain containing-hemolysin-like protein
MQYARLISARRSLRRVAQALGGAAWALGASLPAHAAFFQGEALDTVADIMAIVVLIVVPIVVIVLFWLVHVLPERFAEKFHHPQAKAIQVLCLLSLVFGGLLWPIAWLWAFTRPVGYRMAYGTDKHEDWHESMGERARAGELVQEELDHLRAELDAMAARGALPFRLKQLHADLATVAARASDAPVAPARAGGKA